MDHVSRLRDPSRQPIQVLYLVTDKYKYDGPGQIHEVRNAFNEAETDCTRLVTLCGNIKRRTTSRPEDEFICLANLLGRSIKDVISWSQKEK